METRGRQNKSWWIVETRGLPEHNTGSAASFITFREVISHIKRLKRSSRQRLTCGAKSTLILLCLNNSVYFKQPHLTGHKNQFSFKFCLQGPGLSEIKNSFSFIEFPSAFACFEHAQIFYNHANLIFLTTSNWNMTQPSSCW